MPREIAEPNKPWRPSAYDSEKTPQMAWDYLQTGYLEQEEHFPTPAGLACYLGVCKATVYNWKDDEDKKDFLDCFNAINVKKETILIAKGADKTFDSGVTRLLLSNHGHILKTEVEGTGITNNTVYIEKHEKDEIEKNISEVVDG